MASLLPIVALALALLGWSLHRDKPAPRFDAKAGLAILLAALVASKPIANYAPEVDKTAILAAFWLGAILTGAGEFVGVGMGAVAMGTFAASLLTLGPVLGLYPAASLPAAQLALSGGAGLAALAFRNGGAATALAATLVAVADGLGMRHSPAPAAGTLGSQLGLAVAVGTLLAGYLPERLRLTRPVVVGLVTMAAALFATRSLNEGGLLLAAGLGLIGGIVLHWLMEGDEPVDALRVGIGTVIGIGIATLAFGFARGAGMALALVGAGGMLLGLGNVRAFLTLGPLVGLVLYRALREAGTGATRALDIGQHYTLLTLILGAVVPLLPEEWIVARRTGERPADAGKPWEAIGVFLWSLLVLAAPFLVIVMFGVRGAVGFVAGSGLAGLLQAVRAGKTLTPLAVAAGVASATILSIQPLTDYGDLTRDDKVRFLTYWGVGILVIAAILAVLTRTPRPEEQRS